jgi:hypothetical protein
MFPDPQDALPLPARPNLEQYKKLAKSLLKACKLQPSNPESIEDWAERWVIRLVKASALDLKEQDSRPVRVNHWIAGVADFVQRQMIPPTGSGRSARKSSAGKVKQSEKKICNLASAQFVIARSHGFRSWPQFVQYGGTVLGQTLWSAAHGGDPESYAQIIETLIAAGAKLPERHVPVNATIDALLERYGSRPEPEWHWFGEEPRRKRK